MKSAVLQWNLILAWIWVLMGFGSGFLLGTGFHQEDWLGGYTSHRRRLYRLAHISFFGLALMNLMFYFTARSFGAYTVTTNVASWAFIAGTITMPVCCIVMAHWPQARAVFLVPVGTLMTAGALTLWEVVNL